MLTLKLHVSTDNKTTTKVHYRFIVTAFNSRKSLFEKLMSFRGRKVKCTDRPSYVAALRSCSTNDPADRKLLSDYTVNKKA